jgi:hypothetical protein
LFFTERTIKIKSDDLKSRIDACQKDCASLKDRFSIRVHVATNIQVQQTGTFSLVCVDAFPLIIRGGHRTDDDRND